MATSKKATNSSKGRPEGSTVVVGADFEELAVEAYVEALSHDYGHPTQKDIATKLGISRATFCRYLKKYSSWEDIRGNALWEFRQGRRPVNEDD